jgi:hypothetical protein
MPSETMKTTPRTFFAGVFFSAAAACVPERNDAALTSPADLSQLLRSTDEVLKSFIFMSNP